VIAFLAQAPGKQRRVLRSLQEALEKIGNGAIFSATSHFNCHFGLRDRWKNGRGIDDFSLNLKCFSGRCTVS
jgi:hypothetical protein